MRWRASHAKRSTGTAKLSITSSKRFRATFNYVLNHFDRGTGATAFLAALPSAYEQEFLFRLAVAL